MDENIAAAAGNDANKLLTQGDANRAAESYRKALSFDPKNAKTWFNLSIALGELGQRPEQRHALEKAIEFDPQLSRAPTTSSACSMRPTATKVRRREAIQESG